jgi:hypothetical protein
MPSHQRAIARTASILAATLAFGASPAPAPRAPGVAAAPTFLPATVGARVHVRLERSVLTARGPLDTEVAFDLVRTSPTLVALRRTDAKGATTTTALVRRADDALAVADVAHARLDPDFADVLNGLNLALAALHGASRAPWTADIAVAVNVAPVAVAFATTDAADGGFAFTGDGTLPAETHASPEPADAPAVAIAVHVDGSVAHARVARITVVQTRSVAVAFVPYVNVARWAFRFSY